jgi:large-conductance mechanosensitive channel
MSNSSRKNKTESNGISTKWVLLTLISVVLIVAVFYFVNFNSHLLKDHAWWNVYQNLSKDTGTWGTFGDYVGGILNPIIAAFAFYLIAKTYELQKKELEATRNLLEISTDAQKDQIKLAALAALLNSNFTRISLLEAENLRLIESKSQTKVIKVNEVRDIAMAVFSEEYGKYTMGREDYIKMEINDLPNKNNKLITENRSLFEK